MKIGIIGAGGLGKEVYWILRDCIKTGYDYEIVGFYDDNKLPGEFVVNDSKVINSTYMINDDIFLVNAIAEGSSRISIVERIGSERFITIIHPLAHVFDADSIGIGSIICAQSIVSVNAILGNFSIVDWNVSIGHDAKIASYCTFFPGCKISGNAVIEEMCTFGTGSIVLPSMKIGKGAGSVVTKNVENQKVMVGIPARELIH